MKGIVKWPIYLDILFSNLFETFFRPMLYWHVMILLAKFEITSVFPPALKEQSLLKWRDPKTVNFINS